MTSDQVEVLFSDIAKGVRVPAQYLYNDLAVETERALQAGIFVLWEPVFANDDLDRYGIEKHVQIDSIPLCQSAISYVFKFDWPEGYHLNQFHFEFDEDLLFHNVNVPEAMGLPYALFLSFGDRANGHYDFNLCILYTFGRTLFTVHDIVASHWPILTGIEIGPDMFGGYYECTCYQLVRVDD
jgi:hypothetical protein